MNDIDRERMIKEIGRCLSGVEDLLLGYLYGSFLVRSDFHDIDIALLVSGEREPYERILDRFFRIRSSVTGMPVQ